MKADTAYDLLLAQQRSRRVAVTVLTVHDMSDNGMGCFSMN